MFSEKAEEKAVITNRYPYSMKLYFTIIGAAMALISAVNIVLQAAPWHLVILSVILCTALQFVLDGIVAATVSTLPDRWFGANNPLFLVAEKEKKLYKKLKVRRWKDKVWELGGLGGFSKRELKEPDNPRYIEKFLIECNRGTVTHRLSYPIGFLAMLAVGSPLRFTVAIPVATVNLFLNVLPTLVLRYNAPMLRSLLKRLEQKKNRKHSENSEIS
ncbi:MAG: hypothetical protein E7629_08830 [Ruminococcaceae bacterium]|nr:hypothetical protein [Oscillospiraceae bacterium]